MEDTFGVSFLYITLYQYILHNGVVQLMPLCHCASVNIDYGVDLIT